MVRHANTQHSGKRGGKRGATKASKSVITTRTKVLINSRNRRNPVKTPIIQTQNATAKGVTKPSGKSVWNRVTLTPTTVLQLGEKAKAQALLNRSVTPAASTDTPTSTTKKPTGYSRLAKKYQAVNRSAGERSWIDPLLMDLAEAITVSDSYKGKADKPAVLERTIDQLYAQARAQQYTNISDKVEMYRALYVMRQQTKSRDHEECLSRMPFWEKMTVNEFYDYMEPELLIAKEKADYDKDCREAEREKRERWERIRKDAQ